MLTLQLFTTPTSGRMIADFGGRLLPPRGGGLTFSTNAHGFQALACPLVPMGLTEAFELYDWPGTPHAVVTDHGGGVVWEGRLEDVSIVPGGVALTALGYQRAFHDVPYTALWSHSGSGEWREATSDDGGFVDGRYEMDNNRRVYIAPKKGEVYANAADTGGMTYAAPHNGSRNITNFECDYEMLLPSGWTFKVFSYEDDFTSGASLNSVTATGSLQTGSLSLTLGTPRPRLVVFIRNDSGSSSTITAETGVNYLKLTALRVKTTTETQVMASDIAAALALAVYDANNSQLTPDALEIEATSTDLQDELYEDQYPAEILDRLALLHTYEWGVWEGRRLRFRPRGVGGRHWYVDVTNIAQLQRSLERVRNSAYGLYRDDSGGRALRTANVGDEASQQRYGIVRRGFVDVQTTSLAEAQLHRSTWLADRANDQMRADIVFDRLYDAAGGVAPLYHLRAGDRVTMRNLSPVLSTDVDRIRTFVVGETEYDAVEGTISIAPLEPLPGLDVLVARRGAGL